MKLPYVINAERWSTWSHYWLVTVPRLEEPVGLVCVLVPDYNAKTYLALCDELEELRNRSRRRVEALGTGAVSGGQQKGGNAWEAKEPDVVNQGPSLGTTPHRNVPDDTPHRQ